MSRLVESTIASTSGRRWCRARRWGSLCRAVHVSRSSCCRGWSRRMCVGLERVKRWFARCRRVDRPACVRRRRSSFAPPRPVELDERSVEPPRPACAASPRTRSSRRASNPRPPPPCCVARPTATPDLDVSPSSKRVSVANDKEADWREGGRRKSERGRTSSASSSPAIAVASLLRACLSPRTL